MNAKREEVALNVIVIGAGWLAKELQAPLALAGFKVYQTTRSPQKLHALGQTGLLLKFSNELEPSQALQSLIHGSVVICTLPASRREPESYLDSLTKLATWLRTSGALACIHTSSSAVYQGLSDVVNEAADLVQGNERVSLLVKGERILRDALPTCTLRLSGLMGPARHPGRFLSGKELSEPAGPVNMVHSKDCANFIVQVLKQQLWPEVFNLSCPLVCSRGDFYQRASADLGLAPPRLRTENLVTGESRKVCSAKAMRVENFCFEYPKASDALGACY